MQRLGRVRASPGREAAPCSLSQVIHLQLSERIRMQ
jgi:hypothetical protein